MKKRGFAFILGFLGLFFINFVSAQFFDGYGYGSFSITGFFDNVNPQDLTLLAFFIIVFALIYWSLSKFFIGRYGQPNKGIPTVISLTISLIATYEIYRSGFNIEEFFYGLGLPTDFFYPLLLVILIAAAVFIIWAFGRRKEGFSLSGGLAGLFFISGILIILITLFTDLIYEKGIALVIGIIFLLIGLWLWKRARRSLIGAGRFVGEHYDWRKEKSQWRGRTYVLILGILTAILGLGIGQSMILIAGIILTLIGAWLWWRPRPGLYRPLGPGYYPIQERRQLRAGTPVLFLGILIVILGLLLSQTIIIITGAVLAAIGFFLRMIR